MISLTPMSIQLDSEPLPKKLSELLSLTPMPIQLGSELVYMQMSR